MPDINDIDGLLFLLSDPHHSRYSAALRMLVAERNGLKEMHAHLGQSYTMLTKECDALKQRVAELEAHPPADLDRDLRERLVCAALTGLNSNSDLIGNASDLGQWAIDQADQVLAAMRKGEQP
jgi:hypothetical protein